MHQLTSHQLPRHQPPRHVYIRVYIYVYIYIYIHVSSEGHQQQSPGLFTVLAFIFYDTASCIWTTRVLAADDTLGFGCRQTWFWRPPTLVLWPPNSCLAAVKLGPPKLVLAAAKLGFGGCQTRFLCGGCQTRFGRPPNPVLAATETGFGGCQTRFWRLSNSVGRPPNSVLRWRPPKPHPATKTKLGSRQFGFGCHQTRLVLPPNSFWRPSRSVLAVAKLGFGCAGGLQNCIRCAKT